ncbi:MAG: TRAP transporter large permease subunit [Candidatus Rokubacteria bacterium]|nr:TRAP transporter large permease subunit [Candidatus Rokubacteria bacterium]
MLLIEAASTFAYLMAVNHLPDLMARAITAVSSAPWFFLVVNSLIFIFIGSILEGLPALIIFVPILFPMVQQLGIDPIHYGILVIAATGIGLFIPPAGVGLIIACSIGQVTLGEVTRPLLPFLVVLCVGLLVLTVVPWFSVSVPQLLLR